MRFHAKPATMHDGMVICHHVLSSAATWTKGVAIRYPLSNLPHQRTRKPRCMAGLLRVWWCKFFCSCRFGDVLLLWTLSRKKRGFCSPSVPIGRASPSNRAKLCTRDEEARSVLAHRSSRALFSSALTLYAFPLHHAVGIDIQGNHQVIAARVPLWKSINFRYLSVYDLAQGVQHVRRWGAAES